MIKVTTEVVLSVTKVVEVPESKIATMEALSQDEFIHRSFEDAVKNQFGLDNAQVQSVKLFIHDGDKDTKGNEVNEEGRA